MDGTSPLLTEAQEIIRTTQATWAGCKKCSLCERRYQIVFGAGPAPSNIVVIGEAPGAKDDEQGKPFQAAVGEFLDMVLEALHIKRESVFTTNIVACRLDKAENASATQIAACRPRLLDELYAADPLVIVTLGAAATSALLKKKVALAEVKGTMLSLELPGKNGGLWEVTVVPTYDPAYILKQVGSTQQEVAQEAFKHVRIAVEGLQNYERLRRSQWQTDSRKSKRTRPPVVVVPKN
jgi:uracil-DNA glycosylase